MSEGAVEARAFAAMDERLEPDSPACLAVAVSGGGDSVALLELAAAWARRRVRPLRVLHLDHRLHPDSAAWARSVRAHAERVGWPCELLAWDEVKPASGLPVAARAVRHARLAKAARAAGARVILLGHTLDDLEEGERMRREGSSLGRVRAWGPSPAWPEGRGIMLLRPMLELRRAELRGWLSARGLPWIEDPANADRSFARARARLAAAAEPIDAVPEAGPSSPGGIASDGSWGLIRISRPAWMQLDPARASVLLSAGLVCAAGGSRPPRGRRLRRLLDVLSGPGPVTATLAGARVVPVRDHLLLGRDQGRDGPQEALVRLGERLAWDGRAEL